MSIEIIGPAFSDISWANPPRAYALSLAFLFGMSERFFGDMVSSAESKMIIAVCNCM